MAEFGLEPPITLKAGESEILFPSTVRFIEWAQQQNQQWRRLHQARDHLSFEARHAYEAQFDALGGLQKAARELSRAKDANAARLLIEDAIRPYREERAISSEMLRSGSVLQQALQRPEELGQLFHLANDLMPGLVRDAQNGNANEKLREKITELQEAAIELQDQIARQQSELNSLSQNLENKLVGWQQTVEASVSTKKFGLAWEEKLSGHGKTWKFAFVAWVILSTISIVLFIYYGAPTLLHVINRTSVMLNSASMDGTIGIAVTATWADLFVRLVVLSVPGLIVLWLLRTLMRTFYAERALEQDARERLAMRDALLSLTAAEKLSDDAQRIVMGALFRPAALPVVDDGAPHMWLESALKALNPK